MEVVHGRDGHVATTANEVAVRRISFHDSCYRCHVEGYSLLCDKDCSHGAQENSVAAKECEELLGRCQDFPLKIIVNKCSIPKVRRVQRTGTQAQAPMKAARI